MLMGHHMWGVVKNPKRHNFLSDHSAGVRKYCFHFSGKSKPCEAKQHTQHSADVGEQTSTLIYQPKNIGQVILAHNYIFSLVSPVLITFIR